MLSTALLAIASTVPMTGSAEESVAWEAIEPASTHPVQEGYVDFTDEGQPQLLDEAIKRRDPSDIIKVGETYYVWYTKILEGTQGFPGGWGGTVWYATSPDGRLWTEQDLAIAKSSKAADWDSHGAYTPNIAVYKGRYFLAYTAQSNAEPRHVNRRTGIGIAVSGKPEGPWEKLAHNPVIAPGDALADADGFVCDDTVFIAGMDGLILYYKGWAKMHATNGRPIRYKSPKGAKGKQGGSTFLLGAVSANPGKEPFIKFSKGPLHRAHEMVLWPEADGSTGSFAMGWGKLLYYRAKDGQNFVPITTIESRQAAAGLYRADFGSQWDGSRPSWGLKMDGTGLQRFSISWPDTPD